MLKETFVLFVVFFFSFVSGFPENLLPVNPDFDAPTSIFTGSRSDGNPPSMYVQLLKKIKLGSTTRIAVAARENLYLLNPNDPEISNGERHTKEISNWKSLNETSELCMMKGQSKELCHNYLSVLEPTSNEELLVCGTNSYSPICRKYEISVVDDFISLENAGADLPGEQRCPFGPNQPSTSLFTGDSLYSATFQSFFGGQAVLSRTMGSAPALRTDTGSHLMNKPHFVKMVEDEKRVMVFLNEIEMLPGGERRTIPQVAQVCKNDVGGDRILEGLFTSFVKARLNCSYNGFYLNQLTSLSEPVRVKDDVMLFATFSTPENSLPGSAVCSFTLSSIQETLHGPFVMPDTTASSAGSNPPAEHRHPGLCSADRPTDDEMLFVRSHPQLKMQAPGELLLTNQGKRWTAIHAENIDGNRLHSVIFIGTDDGHLIRALPPSPQLKRGLLISEQDVFDQKKCSTSPSRDDDRRVLYILVEKKEIYVAFKHCVVTVPLQWCSSYLCESTCEGSGDPYCGWNGSSCAELATPILAGRQKLKGRNSASAPCQQLGTGDQAGSPDVKSTMPSKESANSTEWENIAEPVELEKSREPVFTLGMLIFAVLGTAAGTVVLILCPVFAYCVCRRPTKAREDDNSFGQKQMVVHEMALRDEEKRDSLSRRAQRFLSNCKESLAKSPITSPKNRTRDHSTRRRQNDYTPAPSLKNKQENERSGTRTSKTRLNSTSSVSSRHDSICVGSATKPLLGSNPTAVYNSSTEATVSRRASEAATLRISAKSGSEGASSSSPTRPSPPSSSGAKTSVDSSAPNNPHSGSAQLRRRSERADRQASEIMRESDTAIREFENAYLRMEEQGLVASPPHQHQLVQNLMARQRLESDDSGKGESPRNSLKTESSSNDSARASRAHRPASFGVRVASPNRRNRLLSEGSRPHDPLAPILVGPRGNRERHSSGHQLIGSQPSTPVGGPQRLSLYQNNQQGNGGGNYQHVDASAYGTLQRNEQAPDLMSQQTQQPGRHPENVAMVPFYQQQMTPNGVQLSHSQPYRHQQVKLQRQMSEPHARATAIRPYHPSAQPMPAFQSGYQEVAPQQPFYPPVPDQPVQGENPVPRNHYPSLPHRSSTSPYGENNNSYGTGSGFERPATLHRREKMASTMRQASTPTTARTGVYVPPPTVPGEGSV